MSLEGLRIGFAFSAGVMTFFAPCAYPLLPGYLAYFLGGDTPPDRVGRLRHAVGVGITASLGVTAVYVGLAGVAVTVGARYLQHLVVLGIAVGFGVLAVGVAMLAGVTSGQWLRVQLPERQRSYRGYAAFGAGYAIAAAGCTAPLFVAVALSALEAGPLSAAVIVGAYTAGMCSLLVSVTILTAIGRGSLLRRIAPEGGRLKRLAGGLLVVAGTAQLYLFLVTYGGVQRLVG